MKRALTVLAITLAVLGCTPQQPSSEALGSEAPNEAATPAPSDATGAPAPVGDLSFAVVPKGLTHQFWLTVKKGAETAAAERNIKMTWLGPEKETDVVKQINIIEDMIGSGVNGIVMAACDQDALADVVKRASDKGITVVTIDSGVNSEIPASFVATDNAAGAAAAAKELARLINNEGEVGVIPFVKGASTSELREQGFMKGIAEFPNIKVVAVQHCQSDVSKAMNVTEDMLTANPNLKGIFAANEPAALGAAQAIEAAGKTGQVKIVAFDASDDEVSALKRGVIQALAVQNPFKMGYEGVKAAFDYIKGQPVEKRIDTGITLVTQENMNDPEILELLNPL